MGLWLGAVTVFGNCSSCDPASQHKKLDVHKVQTTVPLSPMQCEILISCALFLWLDMQW